MSRWHVGSNRGVCSCFPAAFVMGDALPVIKDPLIHQLDGSFNQSFILWVIRARRINHASVVQGQIFERFIDQGRSEEHTSELQSRGHLVCRLLLEKKKESLQ